MKPCFHFEMKFLLVGMVISLLLGTTISNAQEITPTVDLNAYTPQGKERLKEIEIMLGTRGMYREEYNKAKITGWVKGKNFVDGTPIRIEFTNGIYEGTYHVENEQSFIDGRYEEYEEKDGFNPVKRHYKSNDRFFVHQKHEKMLYARSMCDMDVDNNRGDRYLVYELFTDRSYALIQKKLLDGSWLQQLIYPDIEEEMDTHDTIYRKKERYDSEHDYSGIWNIVFKDRRYEGLLPAKGEYCYLGKLYTAFGTIYDGKLSKVLVNYGKLDVRDENMAITFPDGEYVEKGWWGREAKNLTENEKKNFSQNVIFR